MHFEAQLRSCIRLDFIVEKVMWPKERENDVSYWLSEIKLKILLLLLLKDTACVLSVIVCSGRNIVLLKQHMFVCTSVV